MISGFDIYETWNELLEENAEDQRFQNNFSKQLLFHIFSIIEGVLILSAGMYFTIRYLQKRKIDKKQEMGNHYNVKLLRGYGVSISLKNPDSNL